MLLWGLRRRHYWLVLGALFLLSLTSFLFWTSSSSLFYRRLQACFDLDTTQTPDSEPNVSQELRERELAESLFRHHVQRVSCPERQDPVVPPHILPLELHDYEAEHSFGNALLSPSLNLSQLIQHSTSPLSCWKKNSSLYLRHVRFRSAESRRSPDSNPCRSPSFAKDLTSIEQYYPDLLSPLPSPPVPIMPNGEGCLRYEERFGEYRHPLGSEVRPNYRSGAKELVIVRLHGSKCNNDSIFNIRALIKEGGWDGKRHVIIAYNGIRPPESIPGDLLPYFFCFTYSELQRLYPTFLSYHNGEHILLYVEDITLKRYERYWNVEGDARFTGSWNTFFTSAVELSKASPAYKPRGILNPKRFMLGQEGDLITFTFLVDQPQEWYWRDCIANWVSKSLQSSQGMIWGVSKELLDLYRQYCERRVAAHIEILLPTIALEEGLKLTLVRPPPGSSFDCCDHRSETEIYIPWVQNSTSCLPALLLHPIKVLPQIP